MGTRYSKQGKKVAVKRSTTLLAITGIKKKKKSIIKDA
jgi:hypothetical protein